MIRLELVQGSTTIDLNSVLTGSQGVQALLGATGFGLPPVAAQWDEGAGNGSAFRGSRVLSREVDLPIYVTEANRSILKATLSKLAIALANECQLRFIDTDVPTEYWYIDVRRTGGGEYTYGQDTTGDDLQMVLTLKSGDPFWKRGTIESFGPYTTFGAKAITMPGDAPTSPTIRVTGPALNVRLVGPLGDVAQWLGTVAQGKWVEFDFEDRTVTDSDGNNRYDGLAASPRFWQLSGGGQSVSLETDNSSATFTSTFGAVRRQFVTNPRFTTALTGWSVTNLFGQAVTNTREPILGFGTSQLVVRLNGFQINQARIDTGLTGLTVGKEYTIRVSVWRSGNSVASTPGVYAIPSGGEGTVVGAAASATTVGTDGRTWSKHAIEFKITASTTSYTLRITSASGTDMYTAVESASVIDDSGAFFDGATPAAAGVVYAWTGTANASQSTATTTINSSLTNITMTARPRRWAVI